MSTRKIQVELTDAEARALSMVLHSVTDHSDAMERYHPSTREAAYRGQEKLDLTIRNGALHVDPP